MNRKKIMILGAGVYQLPLIKQAKEMGLTTIVASIPGDYPGFDCADKSYYIDTTDKESLLKVAKKEEIDGIVTTGSDVAVSSIGYICEKLGLPGMSGYTADIVTDKALFREKMNGVIHTPKSFKLDLDSTDIDVSSHLPCMLKVVDSSGSRGVYKVYTINDFFNYLNDAKRHTHKNYVILEDIIVGEEIGCEAIICNKKIIGIFPHKKIVTTAKTDIPVGHIFPSYFAPEILNEINEQMSRAISELEIVSGLVNADIIISSGKAYIIDFGARCGATGIPEIISESTESNLYEVILRLALGEGVDEYSWRPRRIAASQLLTSNVDGYIKDQRIVGDLDQHTKIQFDYNVGDYVEKFQTGQQRIGMIVCTADSEIQAISKISNVRNLIHITVD